MNAVGNDDADETPAWVLPVSVLIATIGVIAAWRMQPAGEPTCTVDDVGEIRAHKYGNPKANKHLHGRLIIPESVTSVGANAFYYANGVTSLVIPSSMKQIGPYTFRGMHGLKSVVIPGTVESIGTGAFEFCTSLKSVVIPDSVQTIGSAEAETDGNDMRGAFEPDCEIKFVTPRTCSVNDVGEIPRRKYRFGKNSDQQQLLGHLTIPEGVTSIGEEAFSKSPGITSVHFPDSLTSIGRNAFAGCTGLTSVILPANVSLHRFAFPNLGLKLLVKGR